MSQNAITELVSRTAPVPVTFTPDAERFAVTYRLHRELAAFFDYARQNIRGLKALRVEFELGHDTFPNDYLVVAAVVAADQYDPESHWAWDSWRHDTFSVPVCEHIHVTCYPESENGR